MARFVPKLACPGTCLRVNSASSLAVNARHSALDVRKFNPKCFSVCLGVRTVEQELAPIAVAPTLGTIHLDCLRRDPCDILGGVEATIKSARRVLESATKQALSDSLLFPRAQQTKRLPQSSLDVRCDSFSNCHLSLLLLRIASSLWNPDFRSFNQLACRHVRQGS